MNTLKHDYRSVVVVLLFFMAIVAVIGKTIRVNEIEWQVMKLDNELKQSYIVHAQGTQAELDKSNQRLVELDLKLKAATASSKAQKLTPAEAREMISLTFPPQMRERFQKITMQCENGTLETHRENRNNSNGSYDVGMSQINSVHKAQVEKMFGMDFETAMQMPILNYIFAAYMADHAGNLEAWVCDRIIK